MSNAKCFALLAFALFGIAAAATATTNSISNATSLTILEVCAVMPAGATVLRPKSCTHWVRCPSTAAGNDFEEGACLAGLYYNKDSGLCEPMSKVQCPYNQETQTGTSLNRCAQQKDGVFLADASADCSHYIFCSNGKEMKSTCPGDLVFHPEHSACVYRNEYSCPKTLEVRIPDPICRSVPNDLHFAHEHECIKYRTCVNGTLVTQKCPDEQAFDHVGGSCLAIANVTCLSSAKMPEPENTICGTKAQPRVGYFSDEISCSGYFICGEVQADGTPDRTPFHMHCETGLFFDAKKLSCRDRLNVKCNLDRCEGMASKYVNIAGNCSAYARCKDGHAVNTGSCPSNYFFDERTQGCTPQNISYAACSA